MSVFKTKIVACKCGGLEMTMNRVNSRYGKDYCFVRCESCFCQSPLKAKAVTTVNAWNSHFGERAKKKEVQWTLEGSWEQFL